jgi:nucleolar MIF4G domain-containing protein 1
MVLTVLTCAAQEKAYNPFYTLVMQRLVVSSPKTAHSYQVTLQYALWDVLRDMGEATVGGTERLASGTGEAQGETVSSRKARNLARAYGWWLAKGTLTLSIFKVSAARSL